MVPVQKTTAQPSTAHSTPPATTTTAPTLEPSPEVLSLDSLLPSSSLSSSATATEKDKAKHSWSRLASTQPTGTTMMEEQQLSCRTLLLNPNQPTSLSQHTELQQLQCINLNQTTEANQTMEGVSQDTTQQLQ